MFIHDRVFRNPSKQTRLRVPFLRIVQADPLSVFESRVGVRLLAEKFTRVPVSRLHPRFAIDEQKVVMVNADMASVSAKILSEAVADLSSKRVEIVAAID